MHDHPHTNVTHFLERARRGGRGEGREDREKESSGDPSSISPSVETPCRSRAGKHHSGFQGSRVDKGRQQGRG